MIMIMCTEKRKHCEICKKNGFKDNNIVYDHIEKKIGYYNLKVLENFASLKFLEICKRDKFLKAQGFKDSDECEMMYSKEVYMCTQSEGWMSDIVFKTSSALFNLNQELEIYEKSNILDSEEL